MALKRYANFEEKLTCGLKKDLRNLGNFHQSSGKSQNWDFDGILSSKVEKVWLWNLQRSYVSWQWRIIQNLKMNWVVISKLTWRIEQILTRALENLKKLLFNWLLWPKYITFELRKVPRSYVWWHWRLIQNLKETRLALSKMTWEICQICIGWNKWIANLTKLFYTDLTESSLFLDLRYK